MPAPFLGSSPRPLVGQFGIVRPTVKVRVGLGVVIAGVKQLAVPRADLEGEELTAGVAGTQIGAGGEGILGPGPQEGCYAGFAVAGAVLAAVDIVGLVKGGSAPEGFAGSAVVCRGCL